MKSAKTNIVFKLVNIVVFWRGEVEIDVGRS